MLKFGLYLQEAKLSLG